MGYFDARVGGAVATSPTPSGASRAAPAAAAQAAQPLFGSAVGRPPVRPGGQAAPVTGASTAPTRCPLCQGATAEEEGGIRCQGRCRARWVLSGGGRWVALSGLAYGACTCCRPRRALVAAACGAICPTSHTEYLLLPEGTRPRHEVAPLGSCHCCLPPQPLVMAEGALVCRAKPHQHYRVEDGRAVWGGVLVVPSLAAAAAAIDSALGQNSALLTVNGLFEVGT